MTISLSSRREIWVKERISKRARLGVGGGGGKEKKAGENLVIFPLYEKVVGLKRKVHRLSFELVQEERGGRKKKNPHKKNEEIRQKGVNLTVPNVSSNKRKKREDGRKSLRRKRMGVREERGKEKAVP